MALQKKTERIVEINPEQHIPEVHFAHLWVRTSKSHSRRTSPSQVFGSCDSLLCRTPFQKTIINYFLFTNRFRCTRKEKHHARGAFHKADLTYRENQSRRGDSRIAPTTKRTENFYILCPFSHALPCKV